MVAMLESGTDERRTISADGGQSPDEELQVEEETTGKEQSAQTGELGITAELVLHPFNNAVQALWLCEQLKEELKAEILYVAGSPEGTIIKVSIRNPVSMVDFLSAMTELAEAWEQPKETVASYASSAARLTARTKDGSESSSVVCVSLKLPFDELLQMDATRELAARPRII